MDDPLETSEPKPRTLKLFRKKYPPVAIALGVLGVLAAVAFMIYMIWAALQPPDF
jgi:hypothetical protein